MEKEPLNNLQLIEAYIEGHLSEEEILRVKSLLESDPDFREEFKLYNTIVDGIRSGAAYALRKELIIADEGLDIKLKKGGTNSYCFTRIAAVILLFTIATSVIYFIVSGRKVDAIQQVYVDDPGLPVRMNADSKTMFDNAMSYYKTGETDKAISLLEELNRNFPDNDTVRYYMGVLLIKSGHHSKAEKQFEFVLQREIPSAFKNDAEYRLAFSLWLEGRKDEAIKQFRQIKDNPLHSYHQAAIEALKALE